MKKYILFTILLIAACDQIESSDSSSSSIEYIYEPTYQKEWKIGSSENIMIVQQMHKAIEDGDFDLAYSFMSDDIIIQHGDGSQTNSLEEFKELYGVKDTRISEILIKFNLGLLKFTRPFLPPFFRLIAPARWANQRIYKNPNLRFKDKVNINKI